MTRWVLLLSLALVAIARGQGVLVHVIDSTTREPVTRFEYFAIVETADGKRTGTWRDWKQVESLRGEFTLELPAACKLSLGVRAREYVYDYPGSMEYTVTADEATRHIEHAIERGVTVRGRVLDAAGKPVAGAAVSPLIFTPPGSSPDHERKVLSDAQGRFELPGVRHGFVIEHREFLDSGGDIGDGVKGGETIEWEGTLEAGEKLFGIVKDADGVPVEGAGVEDGTGKSAKTDAQGKFELSGCRKWFGDDLFSLSIEKNGFVRLDKTFQAVPADGLAITLERTFQVRGRVVDPEGRPMRTFQVRAGPGHAPQDWQSATIDITDSQTGEFALGIEFKPDENWVGISAPGFAPYETWVAMDRSAPGLEIRLERGVEVSGRVVVDAGGAAAGTARLLFDRIEPDTSISADSMAKELFSQETAILPDGTFTFSHVRPGLYVLHVGGNRFTGRWMLAGVGEGGLAVKDISVEGVGRVSGTVLDQAGKPWAFKDGEIDHPALAPDRERDHRASGSITFRTDEHGAFSVDAVPSGECRVHIPYNLTADIIGGSDAEAKVLAGATVSVSVDCSRMSGSTAGKGAAAVVRIRIGDDSNAQRLSGTALGAKRQVGFRNPKFSTDRTPEVTGRPPRFRVQLDPADKGEGQSEMGELDADGNISILDVQSGIHTLAVVDSTVSGPYGEPIFKSEVTIGAGTTKLDAILEASSITGRAVLPDEDLWEQKRWAICSIFAVGSGGLKRTVHADDRGNFCHRFLPAGEYTIFARQAHLGWCRFPATRVKDEIADVGEQAFKPGANVRGTIRVTSVCPVPTELLARHSEGVEFVVISYARQRSKYVPAEFTIPNLWPGEWELQLVQNEIVLGSARFVAPESGEIKVEIVVP